MCKCAKIKIQKRLNDQTAKAKGKRQWAVCNMQKRKGKEKYANGKTQPFSNNLLTSSTISITFNHLQP
jgi:hypothetical protein